MRLTPSQETQVIAHAAKRGALPSALSSAQQRKVFTAGMRRNTLVSARVTNARFISEVRNRVARFMKGGHNNSKPELIGQLQRLLKRLGYTPEKGFKGDAARGIPSAEAGSIQDLSSWSRLELILETERALANGHAFKLRGLSPVSLYMYPAYELRRTQSRKQPRGSIDSGSPGWGTRWVQVKGPAPVDDNGSTKLIALKQDDVWPALGSSANFDDALDVDHPPFAFRSGYNWISISRAQCTRLGIEVPAKAEAPGDAELTKQVTVKPAPVNIASLDPATRKAVQSKLGELLKRSGERLRQRIAKSKQKGGAKS